MAAGASAVPAVVLSSLPSAGILSDFYSYTDTSAMQKLCFYNRSNSYPGLDGSFFRDSVHIFHFPGRCRGKQEDNIAAYPCQCLPEHTFQLQGEREIKQ